MRKRISPKELDEEGWQVLGFFLGKWVGGFYSTQELYDRYKKQYPKTKLSLNGFGRMIPPHFEKAVKRIDNKLYRGVKI